MYIDVNVTSGNNILGWAVQNAEVIAHTILNASKSYLLGKNANYLPNNLYSISQRDTQSFNAR